MFKTNKKDSMRVLASFMTVMFLMVAVVSCAPKEFTQPEKAVYTTVRSLQAAKELRTTALSSIGDMYKAGTLTDEKFKEDVIRIGDSLQEAINVTSDALLIYNNATTAENKATLAEKVLLYQQVYGEFSDLVMPYILEHMVK